MCSFFGGGTFLAVNEFSAHKDAAKQFIEYNAEEESTAKEQRREPTLLPHFSVHNLRHTFCTRFCENETNLKVIQEIMGHANISTTMDIYNEATMEKKKASFENLDGKIKIG